MKFSSAVVKQARLGMVGFEEGACFDVPLTALLKRKAQGPDWVLSCSEVGVSWVTVTGKNWEEARQNATAKLLDRVHDRLQMYYNLFTELTT